MGSTGAASLTGHSWHRSAAPHLQPVQRAERLLLQELQPVAAEVEMLEAGAQVEEGLPVHPPDPTVRQLQHLG